jgi:hypothetical protein
MFVATADLTETAACKKGRASAAAKEPKTSKLWGESSGPCPGRGSAATVRDGLRRQTIVVRAGHG